MELPHGSDLELLLSSTFTIRMKATKKRQLLGVPSLVIAVVPSKVHLVTLVKDLWTGFCLI